MNVLQTTTAFEELTTEAVMHHGVLTCPPETPLRIVARMMASYRVHSIVVTGDREDADAESPPWGIVSDLDLAEAVASGGIEDRTAGGSARSPLVSIHPGTSLAEAARLMARMGTAHLLVVDPEAGRPMGIVSTLDLAGALTGQQARA